MSFFSVAMRAGVVGTAEAAVADTVTTADTVGGTAADTTPEGKDCTTLIHSKLFLWKTYVMMYSSKLLIFAVISKHWFRHYHWTRNSGIGFYPLVAISLISWNFSRSPSPYYRGGGGGGGGRRRDYRSRSRSYSPRKLQSLVHNLRREKNYVGRKGEGIRLNIFWTSRVFFNLSYLISQPNLSPSFNPRFRSLLSWKSKARKAFMASFLTKQFLDHTALFVTHLLSLFLLSFDILLHNNSLTVY